MSTNSSTSSASRFFRTSAAGSVLSIIRIAAGFARSKYVAVTLGPVGVGLLSQATQLQLLGNTLGTLSMAGGITNRLSQSEANEDLKTEEKMLATSLTLHLALAVVILLAGAFGSGWITNLTFAHHAGSKEWWAFAVILGVPFFSLGAGFLQAILLGLNRYDLYISASIWGTILGFAATMPLIIMGGIDGAFWAYFACGVLSFLPFVFCMSRVRPLHKVFKLGFDWTQFRWLARFCAVGLAVALLEYLWNLFVRREVMITLGATANGILQVPWAMTAYYTPFLTGGLWGHLYPTVARHRDGPAGRSELVSVLKYMALMTTAFVVLLLVGQEVLIQLAYSRAFLDSAQLMPLQFAADFFYFLVFTFNVYFLGTARLRLFFGSWLIFYVIQIAFVLSFQRRLLIWTYPLAYLVASGVVAICLVIWLGRSSRTAQFRSLSATLFICALTVGAQSLVSLGISGVLIRLPIPIFFGIFLALKRDEAGQRWIYRVPGIRALLKNS